MNSDESWDSDCGDSPLTSIVIPVHNGARHLKESVESAINQTYPNMEVVVIDNASTDESREILSSLDSSRLTVHRYSELVPAAANWTRAVHHSSGHYVKLLCADDVLEPSCVEVQVTALEAHPEAVFAASRRRLIRDNGSVMKDAWGLSGMVGLVPGHEAIRRCIRSGGNILGEPGAVLFNADALKNALPWSEEAGYVVDLEMYARLLLSGALWAEPKTLASFRISLDSWSARVSEEQTDAFLGLIDQVRHSGDGVLSSSDVWHGRLMARLRSRSRSLLYARERRRSSPAVKPGQELPGAESEEEE